MRRIALALTFCLILAGSYLALQVRPVNVSSRAVTLYRLEEALATTSNPATGNGSNIAFDGATLCTTNTATQICNPMTGTFNAGSGATVSFADTPVFNNATAAFDLNAAAPIIYNSYTGTITSGFTFNTNSSATTNTVVFEDNGTPQFTVTTGANGTLLGALTDGGEIFAAAPLATPTANAVWIQNDTGATNGMALNVPTGSTNGYSFEFAGTTGYQVASNAALNLGVGASSGYTVTAEPTNGPLTIASDNATSAGSGTVFTASSLPSPSATATPGGIIQVTVPAPTNTSLPVPFLYLTSGAATSPFEINMKTVASTDGLQLVNSGTCTAANYEFAIYTGGTREYGFKCNGAMTANGAITSSATAAGGLTCGGNACTVEETPTINSTDTTTMALAIYSGATGSAVTTTGHCVQGNVTGVTDGGGTATITLSNAAAFTSATSYTVAVSYADSTAVAGGAAAAGDQSSGTSFKVYNFDTASTHTIGWLACGT
jgi:hypothetical protein